MSDWAAHDVTAAVTYMRARWPTMRLNYVGHSFGAQALGLLPNNNHVSRALFVAGQAAYWRLMTGNERYRVYVLMNYIGKPITQVIGYAPGRLGIGEDLPKGVFLEWTKWVNNKRYLFDDPTLKTLTNFAHYRGALRARSPMTPGRRLPRWSCCARASRRPSRVWCRSRQKTSAPKRSVTSVSSAPRTEICSGRTPPTGCWRVKRQFLSLR
jgi:hypothetical protein